MKTMLRKEYEKTNEHADVERYGLSEGQERAPNRANDSVLTCSKKRKREPKSNVKRGVAKDKKKVGRKGKDRDDVEEEEPFDKGHKVGVGAPSSSYASSVSSSSSYAWSSSDSESGSSSADATLLASLSAPPPQRAAAVKSAETTRLMMTSITSSASSSDRLLDFGDSGTMLHTVERTPSSSSNAQLQSPRTPKVNVSHGHFGTPLRSIPSVSNSGQRHNNGGNGNSTSSNSGLSRPIDIIAARRGGSHCGAGGVSPNATNTTNTGIKLSTPRLLFGKPRVAATTISAEKPRATVRKSALKKQKTERF